ncbi:dethiobiotin synthase [Tistrella mobilis]|uniref:ATP-dependent dethiobiotin synthetase BioD n=1 Tax=Tistrella mobilis (strain KA081020-065) TaxID=1110502 RepID=I3THM7_TISMK|nr:dethiobiotin synthase [Tistrella mobilis]AFK52265.1 dithiobiotin synthetase [Tistrella mobilis KA081020-065]
MTRHLVVTGTDTGIGKTVVAAGLAAALGAGYWKPVQSGLDGETDSEVAARLGQLPPERVLPETWRLTTPASPHLAADVDGVAIDPAAIDPPPAAGPLVIEGAGGVLVPLTRQVVFADLFARWQWPVVLCARTSLGTINHSLLSLEALKARAVPVAGVVFIGEAQPDSEAIITTRGRVPHLGRLPQLDPLDADTLAAAIRRGIDLARIERIRE